MTSSNISIQTVVMVTCNTRVFNRTFNYNNNNNNSYLQQYLSLWSSFSGAVPNTRPGKQTYWDRPGIQVDRQTVENSLSSPIQRAAFLAATSRHSGDWLFALPIASWGLRLDNGSLYLSLKPKFKTKVLVSNQT